MIVRFKLIINHSITWQEKNGWGNFSDLRLRIIGVVPNIVFF